MVKQLILFITMVGMTIIANAQTKPNPLKVERNKSPVETIPGRLRQQ